MSRARKTKVKRKKRNASGHLSKFETQVAEVLDELKVKYEYETLKLPYVLPSPVKQYKPDFSLVSDGTIIEVKGWLKYTDQQKMIAVKAAHPSLDIRFVFYDPNKKLPRRKLTHSDWAIQQGFPWTDLEGLQAGIWSFPEGYLNAQ